MSLHFHARTFAQTYQQMVWSVDLYENVQYTSKGSVSENYFYKFEFLFCLFYTILTFSIDNAEAVVYKPDGVLAW